MTGENKDSLQLRSALSLIQGLYYLITGLWPIIHLPSFEKVSGPKQDKWLVKTVGILIAVIGTNLCLAGLRESKATETLFLAIGEAASLTAVDVIYVAQKRIRPIYLLDALIQTALIGGWITLLIKGRQTIVRR